MTLLEHNTLEQNTLESTEETPSPSLPLPKSPSPPPKIEVKETQKVTRICNAPKSTKKEKYKILSTKIKPVGLDVTTVKSKKKECQLHASEASQQAGVKQQ